MVALVKLPAPHAYVLTKQQICSQATYLGNSQVHTAGCHRGPDFPVHSQHLQIQVLMQGYVLEECNTYFEYCSFPPTHRGKDPQAAAFFKVDT